jgi:hypothetical protein
MDAGRDAGTQGMGWGMRMRCDGVAWVVLHAEIRLTPPNVVATTWMAISTANKHKQ